ncbi:MAG: YgiQ family radical SAM protein [Spirochaetes bacterium]|nr:YgiQ family radical SAM protein [Spirochaetota bacterium]
MFIPVTNEEVKNLNWQNVEIVLINGDTYIDSPYSGITIIGKLLLQKGFRVALIVQPEFNYRENTDYVKNNENNITVTEFGEPELFFGISAGLVDSMVANYTSSMKKRKIDDLTPGAFNIKRPDRATIVYSNLVKKYYKNKTLVLGGIEASLRRITHYDVWENRLRKPILFDSKANFLIYGMSELTTLLFSFIIKRKVEDYLGMIKKLRGLCFIEKSIEKFKIIDYKEVYRNNKFNFDKFYKYLNERINLENKFNKLYLYNDQILNLFINNNFLDLDNFCEFLNDNEYYIILPSFEECLEDKNKFEIMYEIFNKNCDPINSFSLIQKVADRYLIHNRPQRYLETKELDYIYELPYEYDAHPFYKRKGIIKALETIKNSITITRGCAGSCTFCSINIHQGKNVISRSIDSILREINFIVKRKDFNGIIYDLGGPTANLFGMYCKKISTLGECKNKDCLYPEVCKNFKIDHDRLIKLYKEVSKIKEIKKVFIQSGIRYDLIIEDNRNGEEYLKILIKNHVGGQLKIAPEHVNNNILKLMKKPTVDKLIKFINLFEKIKKEENKNIFLTFYLISAFLGCTIKEQMELKRFFKMYCKYPIPEQVQIFQPTPSTYATLIYFTERDPQTKSKIFVEKRLKNKCYQKEILFKDRKINRKKKEGKINK